MKYICNICGEEIDNPNLCPFCGSGSDHIILINDGIDEEDTSYEEEVDQEVENDLNNFEDKNSEYDDKIEDEQTLNLEEEALLDNEEILVEEEKMQDKSIFNDFESEEETNNLNEEKPLFFNQKPSKLNYFLQIYGYLYLHDLEKAKKFKVYLDKIILDEAIEKSLDFNKEDFLNLNVEDKFLNELLKQFK